MKTPAPEKVKKLYKGLGSTREQLHADPREMKRRWLRCNEHYTYMIRHRELAQVAVFSLCFHLALYVARVLTVAYVRSGVCR